MDLYATLPAPVEATFGHLADPSHLDDWLPEVAAAAPGASAAPRAAGEPESDFSLTVLVDGIRRPVTGEVTAFEPPWLVGYRLFIGTRTHGLRVTCTAQDGGTRIHVHQPEDSPPLTIDLARLARVIQQAHQGKE